MTPLTIQTVFLLYSAISLLSALLIGALFWNRNDLSAKLWLTGCVLTSVATSITVFRGQVPLIFSYSLMVSFEALSVLLFGESLRRLSTKETKIRLNPLTYLLPLGLFAVVEFGISAANGQLTPDVSAISTFVFCLANLFCIYQVLKVRKEFKYTLFFNFLVVAFSVMSALYAIRVLSVLLGYTGFTFDAKAFNIVIWFSLALFGSVRNLAYIVLRLHLGFSEHSRLNNMNLKLSNVLDERNEMILSLERLNKMASVNALASTLAHEINQPLTALTLNAQHAQRKLDLESLDAPLIKSLVADIRHDIDRVSAVVKSLGRMGSAQAGTPAPVNVLNSIQDIAEIAQGKLRDREIALTIKCPKEYFIKARIGEWQQVLINLMNNASEALAAKTQGQKNIVISAEKKDDLIEISVSDNGPGLSPGQESKVFEPMFTNKASGTGIGLWISRNIVTRFGGEIAAKNLPQGGACFTIRLPSA